MMGHVLRSNCLLKHLVEEKINGTVEVAGRRGRRSKTLKKKRRIWKLKKGSANSQSGDISLWTRVWTCRKAHIIIIIIIELLISRLYH